MVLENSNTFMCILTGKYLCSFVWCVTDTVVFWCFLSCIYCQWYFSDVFLGKIFWRGEEKKQTKKTLILDVCPENTVSVCSVALMGVSTNFVRTSFLLLRKKVCCKGKGRVVCQAFFSNTRFIFVSAFSCEMHYIKKGI